MNTKISIKRSNKYKDDLIILSNKNNLSWATDFLPKSDEAFLKSAAKKEINFVFIPNVDRNVVIQFLKKGGNASYQKEDVRLAGNEILQILSNYKVSKVEILFQNSKQTSRRYHFETPKS